MRHRSDLMVGAGGKFAVSVYLLRAEANELVGYEGASYAYD